MFNGFLLQVEDDGYPTDDVAVIYQKIKEHNWLLPNEIIEHQFCKYDELTRDLAVRNIPVGSIEFVEKCLQLGFNIQGLRRIYVPDSLAKPEFLGRRIATVNSREEIDWLFYEWKAEVLFIKSASKLKCDYSDIYVKYDKIPKDTMYFVSESLNIKSEWRIFVNHGYIQGIKNYSGDPWLLPNKKAVMSMVDAYKSGPTAYTLDVGITKDGSTVLIEVHNFVSCGLYGFSDFSVLNMLRSGYAYELNRAAD